MESQRTLKSQTILKKKYKDKGIPCLGFKTHYKDAVTKTVWFWHKDRPVEQNSMPRNKPIHIWSNDL